MFDLVNIYANLVNIWLVYDAEDCGFYMLIDDEIVIYVQKESDPVDDETDEDEDNNESSNDPSNADAFSVYPNNHISERNPVTIDSDKRLSPELLIPPLGVLQEVPSIGARTATAGSDVVQSGRPIFDDFFQHLWPYIGNNTANVVIQMDKRLWFIRVDQ
ncbi:hypothetical protein TNCV_3662501 [Trichonephila clavipes]|nr:hypothetical protein TNCV_3662501 [Trichonephila clavipes]